MISNPFLAEAIAEEASGIPGLVEVYLTELEGFIRWNTNADALTLCSASLVDLNQDIRFMMDPILGRGLVRHLVFEEHTIVRGEDIAIPNRYYGFLDGGVLIGSFDPGDAKGVFCLVVCYLLEIPRC